MPQQDSFTVFQNPVDSVRVSAQDVTSEKITSLLNWEESLKALWNMVHLEYIAFVCVTLYIVVTRVKFIKTNTEGRRDLIMFLLTVIYGFGEYYLLNAAWLSLFVSALLVNAAQEFIFKWGFRGLEKFGWTPLAAWYLEEVKKEKQNDISRAEQLKKPMIT